MLLIKNSKRINCVCLLFFVCVFLLQIQINLGRYAEARSIDDDDFCQLQLHRIKYFQDPDPRTVQESKKRLKVYEVKSVRAIGRYFSICCNWWALINLYRKVCHKT